MMVSVHGCCMCGPGYTQSTKMEESDYASIEMKELAESLRKEFNNLNPLSIECSISRVPATKRCINPSHYTPKMVSVGPIHHGNKDLQVMEQHKIRYLRSFLQRTEVSIEDFFALIKKEEAKLRNCYGETIPLESDDFARIILVDAVFVIELCLRNYSESFIIDDDRICGKSRMLNDLMFDFWLVENQLPFFILIDLFDLAKTATNDDCYKGLSLHKISRPLRKDITLFFPIDNNLLGYFSEAKHFLDWVILCLQPSQSPRESEFSVENIPSAKELHQAGVKIIRSKSRKSPLDITFNEGTLEIPWIGVYVTTECLFNNLLVFESSHCYTHYFNDYIVFMSRLISTKKDAQLLIERRVIGHRRGDELSNIFLNLDKNCWYYTDFQYSDVVGRLQEHCKYPYNKWKAILKQNYFSTPWASISVIGAVILLVLTFIQTTCSVIAL